MVASTAALSVVLMGISWGMNSVAQWVELLAVKKDASRDVQRAD